MDHLETSTTSSRTADCTAIVLRETERVRLIFRPMILVNDAQPRACIKGDFVYESRNVSGEWQPANSVSLATAKTGEQYKLELHSAELLKLLENTGAAVSHALDGRGSAVRAPDICAGWRRRWRSF